MPDGFLNRVFQEAKDQKSLRHFYFRNSGIRGRPLSKVDVDFLIDWCQARRDADVWGMVAYGISLWTKGDNNRDLHSIEPSAIKFLEAAPEPEKVLDSYADRVAPNSWSGSRVNIMRPRANALKELVQHERPDIAVAAKVTSIRLNEAIERERVREQREDEEQEQRFE